VADEIGSGPLFVNGSNRMSSWEYLDVIVCQRDWRDSTGRIGELPEIQTPRGGAFHFGALSPLLNELDAEGWELVGLAGHEANSRLVLRHRRS